MELGKDKESREVFFESLDKSVHELAPKWSIVLISDVQVYINSIYETCKIIQSMEQGLDITISFGGAMHQETIFKYLTNYFDMIDCSYDYEVENRH